MNIEIESVQQDLNRLLAKDKKYLLAFSAGPDSVFLLEQLNIYFSNDLNKHIALIYVNYHDSNFVDVEENIVYTYVKKYDLKIFRTDTKYNKEKDKNFENWARDFRYSYFEKIVKENNFFGLLTAHQKSDVIETYLIQKRRNNIPLYYGLKEISYLKDLKIIRPMLSITKEELINILDVNNILYYDDITNKDPHKERTSIRERKFSLDEYDSYIKEINLKNLEIEKMNNKIKAFNSPYDFKTYNSFSIEEKKRFIFDRLSMIDLSKENKKIDGLLKDVYSFLLKREENYLKIKDDLILYKTKDYFFFSFDYSKIEYSFTFTENKKYENEYFKIDLTDIKKFNIKHLPLTIRNYKKGDKISTNITTKDVLNFLKKNNVPYYLRKIYPVFEVDNKIIYVPFYKDIKDGKLEFSFSEAIIIL